MQGLSIIFVNYRSASLLIESIRTLQEFNTSLIYEIIVVDNHSQDKSQEIVLAEFPAVEWIDMGYNSGFARANNAGMKKAKGNVFLLLNPDTVSTDDSITQCYNSLIASEVIAAGVQLYNAEGKPQISGNFFMKGGLNHILPIPYWGDFLRWLGYAAKTKVPNVRRASQMEEVDWISGAFLMIKKEAVLKSGMMDEDFFLYAEEVEWCSRIRKLGKLCIYGDLRLIHLEGGSINTNIAIEQQGYYNLYDKKGLQLIVSNHLRVRKQYGVLWFLFLLMNYGIGALVFFIASFVHRLATLRNPFGDFGRAAKFSANLFKLLTLTPKIISGRPFFYKMF